MSMFGTRILALSLAVLTCVGVTSVQRPASGQITLAYLVKQSSRSSSVLLKSPRGVTYRLSLVPFLDVGKHVVVLELVLLKPGEKAMYGNLLDTTGAFGYQDYVFAALDFVHGARKSAYGDTRLIKLQRLGMEMLIRVVEVHVAPAPRYVPNQAVAQFRNLTLQITIRGLQEKS